MLKLGYIIDTSNSKYFELESNNLNRHLCIFGATGTGKSTTLTILSYELNKEEIPCLILDRTGEFVRKLKKIENCYVYIPGKNLYLSPFDVWNNLEKELKIQNELWLLSEFCKLTWDMELTPLQTRLIISALNKIYSNNLNANFEILIKKVREIAKEEVKLWYESAEAIASRFEIFTIGFFKNIFEKSIIEELFQALFTTGIHIVDLSIFEHDSPKNLFSLILITIITLKMKMMGFSYKPRLVLIIDEAQNLASKNSPNIISKIAMEMRKYGLSLVLASQRPSMISMDILANAGCIISHQLLNAYDIEILKNFASLSKYIHALDTTLYLLKPGEALARTPEYIEGVIVKIGTEEHKHLIDNC